MSWLDGALKPEAKLLNCTPVTKIMEEDLAKSESNEEKKAPVAGILIGTAVVVLIVVGIANINSDATPMYSLQAASSTPAQPADNEPAAPDSQNSGIQNLQNEGDQLKQQQAQSAQPAVPNPQGAQDQNGFLSPSVITRIEPAIVAVACFDPVNGDISLGSGQVITGNGIVTNDHVLTGISHYSYNRGQVTNCYAYFPEPQTYSISYAYARYQLIFTGYKYNQYQDYALLQLGNPAQGAAALNNIPTLDGVVNTCTASDVEVGDPITVFGYPAAGNFDGISETVTTGIISGIEGNPSAPIYKTSAGIDHGNSGGLAVLNKDQCSLGIPTWGVSGLTSGIGYIQSWQLDEQ